jgi:hypothetical protein
MLLPQMFPHLIKTAVSGPLTVWTSADRADEEAILCPVNGSFMANTVSVALKRSYANRALEAGEPLDLRGQVRGRADSGYGVGC